MSAKKRTALPVEPTEPYVEIKRTGRLLHEVTLFDPRDKYRAMFDWPDGTWYVYGASRAERLAERKLRKYLRVHGYALEPTIRITAGRVEL